MSGETHKKPIPIIMAAPLGIPDKRVRLAKTVFLLHNNYNCEIEFWGWKRLPEEVLGANLEGISQEKALVKGGGYRSKLVRLLYLYWVLRVFITTLITAPPRVYCLGFETALPVWAASRFRRRISYIFDDADRLVLIWTLPKVAETFLVWLEKKVSRDSLAHIIPSEERYNYKTAKQYEVMNSPNREQIDEARMDVEADIADGFNVYVNGWLDKTRGLKLMDEAAHILDKEGVDIAFNVAVGNLTDNSTTFLERNNVNYLGRLSHVESLKQYTKNDVVLTFYDPSVKINQYAIPNKWGDAVAMGTPIIVNEGVRTAKALLETGAAYSVAFSDPAALANLLKELHGSPEKLTLSRNAIIALRPDYRPFNEMMAPIIDLFLRS